MSLCILPEVFRRVSTGGVSSERGPNIDQETGDALGRRRRAPLVKVKVKKSGVVLVAVAVDGGQVR